MFNTANVDNRLRYLVRGRVIVFTTSKCVEFVDDALRTSYPLFSQESYPQGYGLTFMVELNGYLTFDGDSFVKISEELNRYATAYYDPKAFGIVRPADSFQPYVLSLAPYFSGDSQAATRFVQITFQRTENQVYSYRFDVGSEMDSDNIFSRVGAICPVGSIWRGPTGYPGLILVND